MTTGTDAVEVEERRGPLPPIRESRVMQRERDEDAISVMEWFNAIAGDQACKLKIDRKLPRTSNTGENVSGVLETVEEKIDDIEEYLREVWGGGTFQLQVQLPNGNGGWKYGKAKTVKIAGPVKMNGVLIDQAAGAAAAAAPAGDSMAGRAIDVSQDVAERERARADRLERELRDARERGGKADLDAMQTLLQPLHDQITALREQNKDLQAQLLIHATKPPPTDPFRDQLLSKAVDGESQRMQEQATRFEQRLDRMRDDHAAELRLIREGHAQDTKRLEDRHDRAMADLAKAHERAMDTMKEAHARELKQLDRSQAGEAKALDVAHQTRVETITAERDRLKAEITALKAEVGALRDKKDKSPSDQLKELAGIKKDLDLLTGGSGDDDADKPWYERLVGALGNSEVAMRVVDRIGGGGDDDEEDEEPQQQAQPPQQQQVLVHPPAGTVVRNPEDGQLYISRGGGMYEGPYTVQQLQAARARKRRRVAAASSAQQQGEPAAEGAVDEGLADEPAADEQQAGEAAPERQVPRSPQVARPNPVQKPKLRQLAMGSQQQPPAPKGKPPKPEDVKLAVTFLESALGRGAKPEDVARAARQLVPGAVSTYIRSVGVDNFLNAVASLKQGSPLVTQHGRTFVRQVAKLLFEGPA